MSKSGPAEIGSMPSLIDGPALVFCTSVNDWEMRPALICRVIFWTQKTLGIDGEVSLGSVL